ncbi:MAG: ABC transporter ATP-binding protein/permease [Clostridia bacterium]|nr:ABC transporter ATP-binding protein/permease [Clostridia bacterium]
MIELKDVTKIYNKDKEDEVKALKDVNITFEDSGLYFITGKSGSGKSTMLNILGGLDSVSDGQVIVDGECLDTLSCNHLDEYRKNKVGFIFQNFNLIEELSVGENIALALDLKGEKTDIEKIQQALKAVDLDGYEKRKASKLSGGQKQRVAMARALVKSPDIILADEPTGNLDSATSQTIFELLKELSKERLVIVVSHDGESVKKYADTIIECVDGEATLNENNKQDKEPILKIKSTLPSKGMSARNIAKLGLGFALRHKFRMIVTLILVVFALSFISVAVTMAQSNNVTVEYSNLIAKGEKIVHLGSKLQPDSNLHNVGGETRISNENVKKICDELPDFKFNKIYYDTRFDGVDEIPEYRENDNFHTGRILGVTSLTDDNLARLGLKMLAGRLPKDKMEVALPAYICDIYLEYGLYNWEKDIQELIVSYNAIIGKSYGQYYKIVGVVDTGLDMAKYEPLKNVPETMTEKEFNEYGNLQMELSDATSHSIHNCIFVSQFYIDYHHTLPTASVKSGSMAGVNISYISYLSASSYGKLYTEEEGYKITKVRDFTTLADDEIIFSRTRLVTLYYNCYGHNKTAGDKELIDFCLNNKMLLQLGEDEAPKDFKIVGIIDDSVNPFPYVARHLIMSESFLSQYDYKDDIIWALYTPLSGDKNKDKQLVALSQSYDIDENFYFPIYWSAMNGLDNGYMFVKIIKYCGVGTGVIFLIFTILMIINYISATISSSQRQIGILKALGAGNRELISIFSIESLLIGLIGFVLAILLSVGWIALCNYIMFFGNNIFMGMEANWLSALAVFGVAVITCALGSMLPIKRLLKKKPIDIINN